jgi:hypothetical protein
MNPNAPTSADATKILVGTSFAAFHASITVTPQSVCDWLDSFHPSAPHRTPGFGCRNTACTKPNCCTPQLAHSSLASCLRLLRTTPTGIPHAGATRSPLVKAHMRKLKRHQTSRGRHPTPGGTIFQDQAEELFTAAPALAATLTENGKVLSHLTFLATLTVTSFDMHLWRRAGEITAILHDSVTISTDADGNETLHIGNSPRRKITGTMGLYACCPARPGCPTCPLRNLRNYLAALELYDVDLRHGHRLFPELCLDSLGDPAIRRKRASHKAACPHTHSEMPSRTAPDCHPQCHTLDYPAITTANVNHWLHHLCREADLITTYNVHAFRSAPVLIMLESGMAVTDINGLMGWAPNSTMWATYARMVQFHGINIPRTISIPNIRRAMHSAARSQPVLPH